MAEFKSMEIATSDSLRKASNDAIAQCMFTTDYDEQINLVSQAKNLLTTAYQMDMEAIQNFRNGLQDARLGIS